MITLNCPHCRQTLQIPEEYAGQTGGCKHCQQTFTVPGRPENLVAGQPTAAPPGSTSHVRTSTRLAVGAFIVALVLGAFLLGKGSVSEKDATPNTLVADPMVSPEERLELVNALAAEGKYQEAIELFEAVRKVHPDAIASIDSLSVAAIYLQLGDRAEHEALCRWMFTQFPGNKKPVDAERTGKAYVIHPDANDPALLAEASKRIDYFVQNEKSGMGQWGRVSQGIAAYRQKRYQDARAILEKEIGNDPLVLQSLALAYAAMTEYATGNETTGLARIADARAAVAKLPAPGTKAYSQSWNNILTSKLALAEAEQLLKESVPSAPTVAQPLPQNESPKALRERALQLAREGNYLKAVAALEEVRTREPSLISSHDAVLFGIVYTLMEDKDGHESFSRWVLDKFADTTDPFDAEHAAKTYLIYPGASDQTLLAKSVNLAQVGVDNADPKHKGRAWIYLSQAMAQYRAGAHEEARTWLQKTMENTDMPNILTLALAYAALNEFSLGDAAKAMASLQKAKAMAEQIPEDAWEQVSHAKIVFGEADAAIGSSTK